MKVDWHHNDLPDPLPIVVDLTRPTGYTTTVWDEAFRTNWLPRVGPASLCVAREITMCLASGDTTVRLTDLGRCVGLTQTSVVRRTLRRLCQFGVARFENGRFVLSAHLTAEPRQRYAPTEEEQAA